MTSSASRSTRASCSPGSPRSRGSSATRTRSSGSGRTRGVEPELEARVRAQVEELQRVNRLRRFLSPQLVDLVIDSGDEGFLRSHRREIVVVFCDLRGLHLVRRGERARRGDGRAGGVSRRARRADLSVRRHARALHRRRADGVLQRPDPLRRRSRTSRRDGCGDARPRHLSSRRTGAGGATTSASASASRRVSRRWAASVSRGGSTTPRSAA